MNTKIRNLCSKRDRDPNLSKVRLEILGNIDELERFLQTDWDNVLNPMLLVEYQSRVCVKPLVLIEHDNTHVVVGCWLSNSNDDFISDFAQCFHELIFVTTIDDPDGLIGTTVQQVEYLSGNWMDLSEFPPEEFNRVRLQFDLYEAALSDAHVVSPFCSDCWHPFDYSSCSLHILGAPDND